MNLFNIEFKFAFGDFCLSCSSSAETTEFSKIGFASLPIELDKISSIQGKQQKI